MTDYYKDLGVSRDADQATIKKEYRRKSMSAHPDRGGDPEDMAKLNAAYECLSDQTRRDAYDRFGSDAAPVMEQKVRGLLIEVINKVVEECDSELLNTTKRLLQERQSVILNHKIAANKARRNLLEKRDRVKSKDGEPTLFQVVIDGKVKELDFTLQRMELDLQVSKAALSMLDQYESDEAVMQMLTMGSPTATTTFTFSI